MSFVNFVLMCVSVGVTWVDTSLLMKTRQVTELGHHIARWRSTRSLSPDNEFDRGVAENSVEEVDCISLLNWI